MLLELKEIPVYYINLQKDVDRNQKMVSMLDKFGFEEYTRIEAVEHQNSLVGCSASHYFILDNFKPPFIILEDDCVLKNEYTQINIPDNSDALYLGVSSWGRMNSHSGPCVKYEEVDTNLLKLYNMLSAHAILFMSERYVDICKNICFHFCKTQEHHDIGYAEVQKYFNVYALDNPMFYQTSSNGTDSNLSSYPSIDFYSYTPNFWLPTK